MNCSETSQEQEAGANPQEEVTSGGAILGLVFGEREVRKLEEEHVKHIHNDLSLILLQEEHKDFDQLLAPNNIKI